MKPNEIKLDDLQRILIGEVPFHFYIELIFRFFIIYLILMTSMRLMGKRMASQLSRNEMAAIASLAAAVGVPLMNPDRGLLPAIIIAAVILTYQILIAKKATRSKKFEMITQDNLDILIEDGVLKPEVMLKTRITRARVFSQLRHQGIRQLGMVKRLYFEAGGNFSLLKEPKPKPGLSILPAWDQEVVLELQQIPTLQVCDYCGNDNKSKDKDTCPVCNKKKWTIAVQYHV